MKNEEGNIEQLIAEIQMVMHNLKETWELICIDDGSTDATLQLLVEKKLEYPELKILSFKRNFGQSSAFDAGFKSAKGSILITLDGDLQNDPKDIPKLVHTLDKGYDLVVGKRAKRKDTFSKKMLSKLANAVRSRICQDGVDDTGCSLKVYKREKLEKIKLYQGMHRFLPALFLIEGFKVTQVDVSHRPRTSGTTKYHFFNRSINTVVDMFAVKWMHKRQLRYKIDQQY